MPNPHRRRIRDPALVLHPSPICSPRRCVPTTRHGQQVGRNAFYAGSSSPVVLDTRARIFSRAPRHASASSDRILSSSSTQVLLVVLAHSSCHLPPTPPIFPNRPTPPRPSAQASYAYKRSICSLRCSVSSRARRKVRFFSLHPSLLLNPTLNPFS